MLLTSEAPNLMNTTRCNVINIVKPHSLSTTPNDLPARSILSWALHGLMDPALARAGLFCSSDVVYQDCLRMTVVKRYVLRLFISLKYITANVVDRNNGRIVTSASTVEHSIKGSLECGRSCNAKAAAVVGEVLAKRLKVDGLDQGQGRGIHVNVNNELEKKGFKNRTKIWAIVNALKNNGIKLILDDNDENTSRPSY
ncbi:unnamed protein product [Prunus brigantina]